MENLDDGQGKSSGEKGMIEHVLHYMRNFKPLHIYPSDVG
jgi:hypothetical protein